MLGKSVCGTPCIYLFSLGKVEDLKKIDYFKEALKNVDCGILYKWGRTIDLKRRSGEHTLTFGSIQGVKVILEIYAHIDPVNVVSAENDIKTHFSLHSHHIQLENFKELVVLNKDEFLTTKEKYSDLQEQYSGCLRQLVDQNNHSQQEIKDLKYQITIKNKDLELVLKDLEIEKQRLKSTLLEKEMEILNLKLQKTNI